MDCAVDVCQVVLSSCRLGAPRSPWPPEARSASPFLKRSSANIRARRSRLKASAVYWRFATTLTAIPIGRPTQRGWRVLYVLHAFQKKSTRGIATPQRHVDLIRQRLRDAESIYKATKGDRAARLVEMKQPDLSKLLRGQFKLVSVEKLMRMLTAFDQDVEITVKPHRKRGEAGRITFSPA